MKTLTRLSLVLVTLTLCVRADEVHSKAIGQVIDGLAKLDTTFRAVGAGKSKTPDLVAALTAGKAEFAGITQGGVSADVGKHLRACADLFGSAAASLAKDTSSETAKLFHCQDDLGELMLLTKKLADALTPLSRLSIAERVELGKRTETLFGKKVIEFPRGDTSPFASGSRSPFASSMWILNNVFDVSVFPEARAAR